MDSARDFVDQHPKLPVFVANIAVSKIIQLIKAEALEPLFNDERVTQGIQSLPGSLKTVAEWIPYVLSGTVRTVADSNTPVGILLGEAVAESLNLIGVKVHEISSVERHMILEASASEIKHQLADQVGREGHGFWDRVTEITGNKYDWNTLLNQTETAIDRGRENVRVRRDARKARGLRRFL